MTETLRAFGLPSDVLLWQATALTLLSYAVGLLGGFVGLALGTVRLPAMLLLGLPVVTAGGTNILVSTLSAAAGSITHLRERRVDRDLVLWMGVPSTIGGLFGGLLAGLAHQGVLLSIVGTFVLWQSLEFLLLTRRSATVDRGSGLGRGRRLAEALIGFGIGVLGARWG